MWNWFAQLALLGSLLGTFLVPSPATPNPAQELAATFFVAHVGGQEDASVVPITVVGGRPVTFEVRVRDAGTMQKAGWQIRLLLDACRFEIPAVQGHSLRRLHDVGRSDPCGTDKCPEREHHQPRSGTDRPG